VFFESTNPLKGRSQFRTRTYVNLAVIAGLFILAVTALSIWVSYLLPGRWLPLLAVDALALGGAYYLHLLWDKRPILLNCRHCGNIISSHTPWFCTDCKKPNHNTAEFPFVHQCEHCKAEPKAYKCHHPTCKHMLFLSPDEDATNYAYRLNSPREVQPQEKRANEVLGKQQSKEDKEHAIEMARLEIIEAQLNERLEIIRANSGDKVKKPSLEASRENLQQFVDGRTAIEQAARLQKAANVEACKGDKASLRRDNLVVDEWVRRQKAGEQ
jgi:hypothetical protein